MESITQAVLGAAVGEAVLGKKIGNKGAILGAIAGTIPDLDVLLIPFFSAIQNISIHRGYSHSILFCFLGAIVFTLLLKRFKWTKDISYHRLGLFSFLGLFTHVLLDAFTSYGTQVFLPFSDYRLSFDSISIVDPVYTIPLMIGLALSLWKYKKSDDRRSWANGIGIMMSSVYLLFTLVHKHQIEKSIATIFKTEGIVYNQLKSIPVSIANLEWYGVARNDSHLYLMKKSPFITADITIDSFPINEHLLEGLDKELVYRMKWFAQDFYTVAEHDGKIRVYNMQCDMQGVRSFGDYKAPTAFYYEVTLTEDSYILNSGMHPEDSAIH